MGSDLTRASFCQTVNKRLTLPLTRVLFDQARRDFFQSEGKKIEKFNIFRGNFPNPNPKIDG